jgi:pimeloyl-ACP methyl ester carboxylesterase
VLATKDLPSGPRPVILWDHGTVGIARSCAPSLFDDVTGGVPAVPQALEHGWVMVAPDYVGMGTEGPTPYLIGTGQAYSALDAVRAAHQLSELSLSNQTVVWGHSQGGNAALWTGNLAPSYAPDLQIAGVAALSPATDLVPLAQSVQGAAAGTVVSAFVIGAYSDTYDDVRFDDYVRPGASTQVREAADRCLTSPSLAVSFITGQGGQSVFDKDLSTGPLGDRLRENTPNADMGGAPLLVAQGTGDEVINISINEKWVPEQCAAGYHLDFRTYEGFSHMGVLEEPSALPDELTAWTVDRFEGKPATPTC